METFLYHVQNTYLQNTLFLHSEAFTQNIFKIKIPVLPDQPAQRLYQYQFFFRSSLKGFLLQHVISVIPFSLYDPCPSVGGNEVKQSGLRSG